MIEAHVCNGGKVPVIRPYPAVACSLCHDGVTIIIPHYIIREYNEKIPSKKPTAINWPSTL